MLNKTVHSLRDTVCASRECMIYGVREIGVAVLDIFMSLLANQPEFCSHIDKKTLRVIPALCCSNLYSSWSRNILTNAKYIRLPFRFDCKNAIVQSASMAPSSVIALCIVTKYRLVHPKDHGYCTWIFSPFVTLVSIISQNSIWGQQGVVTFDVW